MKKSLYLGLTALGFVTAAGSINANNASAKSYAKATSNKWIGAGSANNVVLNGSNALYTKAGTLKGAKVVASTTTLKKLAKSKSSEDNFVAYRVATTNRGSVYYKVVSLDKSYRGWIYGGKSTSVFAGGVTPFTTFKQDAAVSTDNQGNFKFKTVGTTNDGTMLTYKDPMYTVYGSGRQITDSSSYKDDILTITKQGTRTREGDQWVYVEDANNSSVNGWILKSGLTKTDEVSAAQGVTITFINKATGQPVGSQVIKYTGTDKGTMDVTSTKVNVPVGYSADTNPWASTATAVAKGGSTLYYVNQNPKTTKINVAMMSNSNVDGNVDTKTNLYYKLSAAQQTAVNNAIIDVNNQVVQGTVITSANVEQILTQAGVMNFNFTVGNTTYKASYKGMTPDTGVKADSATPATTVLYTVSKA
ncbi:S-layer protein [Lentilactobacillus senioris]|uniref:S-layer protein n=1 Tax=Lentilactobacillus senioris TaxID=931534 RepID=UPI00227DED0E|nr:S-layer protein [Lentilactobacillus senioris]MCY9807341.1 S-layer protein [Lentilactobacillus senioris]